MSERVDELEYIIMGIMHSVDKWLDSDELMEDEVNRAAIMREKVLRIIERKDSRIRELENKLKESNDRLEKVYQIVGEVVEKPNPFEKE